VSVVVLCSVLCIIMLSGYPIAVRLRGVAYPLDLVYQSTILGMLLHGGVAVALAALGIFHVVTHMVLVSIPIMWAIWSLRKHQSPWLPAGVESNERPVVIVMAVILLASIWLNGTPSEVIIGARDAGVYANTGFMIARTGGIIQHDAIVADLAQRKATDAAAAQGWSNLLGVQSADRFMAARMRLAGLFIFDKTATEGAYTPQFLHLFPAWIGLFSALFGVKLGMLATGLAGVVGSWSVGMAGRALKSPWVGVMAMALIAFNSVQVWFSRYPMSETTAQWLFFAAIYGLAMRSKSNRNDSFVTSLIAGAAVGQMILARLDFVFVVIPFGGWLIWRWFRGDIDQSMRWVIGGFAVTASHGVIHLLTISRGYFIDTFFARFQDTAVSALLVFPLLTPALQRTFLLRPCSPLTAQPCPNQSIPDAPWQIGRIIAEFGAIALIIVILFWLRRYRAPLLNWISTLAPLYRRAGQIAAVGVVLAGTYAYVIRPQMLTTQIINDAPQCLSAAQLRAPSGSCLALQSYVGAPIVPPKYPDMVIQSAGQAWAAVRGEVYEAKPLRDLYANSMANLIRVGWYISPLGIILTFAGIAIWLWRGVGRHDWLFVAVTLATAVIFIELSYGTSSQTYIYIMRRYLPNIYPGFAIFAAFAVHQIWGQPWWRKVASGVAAGGALLFLLATIRPVIHTPELQGSFDAVAAIARTQQPQDITIIRGGSPNYIQARDAADVLALPLIAIHDRAAFGLRSEYPERYGRDLSVLFKRWIDEGRSVHFLLGANGALWFPDMHLVKRGDVSSKLPEFTQLRNQKPALVDTLNISYQHYQLVPGTAPLPSQIDSRDTAAQVRGFYPHELVKGRLFAWTTGEAVIRLPLPTDKRTLALTLAAGTRPDGITPEVCVRWAGQVYPWSKDEPTWSKPQCMSVDDSMQTYTFVINRPPKSATDTLLVRIETQAWVAAALDPAINDWRSLGVQFIDAEIRP